MGQLDGIMVLGVPVSLKRPNDAVGPVGMLGGVAMGMQGMAVPGQGPMLALPSAQVNATSRPGLKPGDVYLQCQTTDDATNVMRAMGHRKYDGRQIQMTSFDEGKFNSELKLMM